MTNSRAARSVRIANPLSTIAIFLAFTEVTSGIAATVTQGAIQVAFTAFSLAFPLLVAVGFGVFLWKKPEVLYAPADFPEATPIHAYVEAVRGAGLQASIEAQNAALREIVVSAVESTIVRYRPAQDTSAIDVTEAARRVADATISQHTIVVDLPGSDTFVIPVSADLTVEQFLDTVFYAMGRYVRPYTYGTDWVLVDEATEHEFRDIGTSYARNTLKTRRDERSLAEVGIRPGARLAVQLLVGRP